MNIELLQAAACANQIAMIRNAMRYQWLRDQQNCDAAIALLLHNADTYLDAEIDQAMADEALKVAERAA